MKGLEELSKMDYVGRFVIIGSDVTGRYNFGATGISGRSPPSKERYYEIDPARSMVIVKPLKYDDMIKAFNEGKVGANPELLLYNALVRKGTGIVVSNGKQTEDLVSNMNSREPPMVTLRKGLANWTYEPDKPNYTPRISGVMNSNLAAMSIIRRRDEKSEDREYFHVPLGRGWAKLLATYTGQDVNPLPAFTGDLKSLQILQGTPEELAVALFDAMNPDFRVSVAVMFQDREDFSTMLAKKNLHEVK